MTTDLIVTADDFGLSVAVNEGVERAHLQGVLTSASLMVAAPAFEDAVARARRLPGLRVGLHLVTIDGAAKLSRHLLPDLVNACNQFGSDQIRRGIRYAFHSAARRQLRREISAQFQAFAQTGLSLDHANAHKHMHLHPTVGSMMIDIGRDFGLRAIRVPAEPAAILSAAGGSVGLGARLLAHGCGILRGQARRAGLLTPDAVFGLAWTGHMTEAAILRLARVLPPGVNELYFHPATDRDPRLERLMPDYEHAAELAALCSPRVRAALSNARLTSYGELVAARSIRADADADPR